mmetsp:Transcript_22239/g.56127  ORF Transcript_22239/g.56127 Transcript_22239/m.56127 type:complete len:348 (-) Transcript_22239:1616-2659(-)
MAGVIHSISLVRVIAALVCMSTGDVFPFSCTMPFSAYAMPNPDSSCTAWKTCRSRYRLYHVCIRIQKKTEMSKLASSKFLVRVFRALASACFRATSVFTSSTSRMRRCKNFAPTSTAFFLSSSEIISGSGVCSRMLENMKRAGDPSGRVACVASRSMESRLMGGRPLLELEIVEEARRRWPPGVPARSLEDGPAPAGGGAAQLRKDNTRVAKDGGGGAARSSSSRSFRNSSSIVTTFWLRRLLTPPIADVGSFAASKISSEQGLPVDEEDPASCSFLATPSKNFCSMPTPSLSLPRSSVSRFSCRLRGLSSKVWVSLRSMNFCPSSSLKWRSHSRVVTYSDDMKLLV